MTRLVVTGAQGSVGRSMARHLRADGRFDVIGWTRRRIDTDPCAPARTQPFDLTESEKLRDALGRDRPEVIVHVAGRTHGSACVLFRDNTLATASLLEGVARWAPRTRVVLLGSAAEYGVRPHATPLREDDACVPDHAYGISKHAASLHAMTMAQNHDICVLRVFNVVSSEMNPHQGLGAFLERAAHILSNGGGGPLQVGWLGDVRDFVTVDDLGTSVVRAIERGVGGEFVNVCSGRGTLVRDVVIRLRALLGNGFEIDEEANGLPTWSIGDPSKCRSLLGFVPGGEIEPLLREAAARVTAGQARVCTKADA